MMIQYIIWDWNGTLLDDVEYNRAATNALLAREGLMPMQNLESYRKIFGFPTKEYYRRAGFDFNKTPYESLAEDYSAIYWKNADSCPLAPDAEDVLRKTAASGIGQSILSLSRQDMLDKIIDRFSLRGCFDRIVGANDFYATSKEAAGIRLAKELIARGISLENTVYIGDSSHDRDVAAAIGCKAILYSRGHEDKPRLLSTGAPVIDRLSDIYKFF